MGHPAPSYKGHRYPVEVISHCVWLYFRFPLSYREVEELMLQRGVVISYETIRRWCVKFGQAYADRLRLRRPRPGDKWHLDEVFIKVTGSGSTCGGRSTRTAMCWTSWCSPSGTPRPPSDSWPS
jgi:putative transposase